MAWWLWILIGLGLLVLETATPGGFFAFFFGVGAVLVGMAVALGAGGLPGEWRAHGRPGDTNLGSRRRAGGLGGRAWRYDRCWRPRWRH